jgi:PIN domain nuclease of toxin-antitoxin system
VGHAALILLDTQAVVWLEAADARLGAKARALMDKALTGDELSISAISVCEVAWLLGAGRLTLPLPATEWRDSLLAAGVREVPLGGEVATTAVELRDFHEDPADRLTVATALEEALVSSRPRKNPCLERAARADPRPVVGRRRHSSTRSSRCTISARPR